MSSLDDATREEMIKELFARLDHHMTSVLIDSLKEEDMEAFIKLSNEGRSKEEIEAFIKEKVPNAQEVMTNAMIEFRDTYLSGVIDARNAPPAQANTEPDQNQN